MKNGKNFYYWEKMRGIYGRQIILIQIKLSLLIFEYTRIFFLENPYNDYNDLIFPCDIIFDGIDSNKEIHFTQCIFHGNFECINTETELSISLNKCEVHGKFSLDLSKIHGEFISFDTIFNQDFSANETMFFENFRFHNNNIKISTNFSRTKFLKGSMFIKTCFLNESFFTDAEFSSEENHEALFNRCIFKGPTFFSGTNFPCEASFYTAIFESTISFENTNFGQSTPNFSATSFSSNHPPSIRGIKLTYPIASQENWIVRILGKCALPDGQVRYRALKKIAISNHDYDDELRFFAMEMKAKRFHSYPFYSCNFLLNLLYCTFSNFGQSIVRPLTGLLLTALSFAYCYSGLLTQDLLERLLLVAKLDSTVWTTVFVNMVPFAGQVRLGRSITEEALCNQPADHFTSIAACQSELFWLSAVEGIFAFLFLFLIGLALRNIARIK